jgi:hypothetical protein
MYTAELLRLKAQHCRELIAKATNPEVAAQLELWAREFDEEAAKAEAAGPTVLVVMPPCPTQGTS